MGRNILTAAALVSLLLLGGAADQADVQEESDVVAADPVFGVGERAQFRASWGMLGRVGTGTLSIVEMDTVRGRPALHAVFTIKGGIPGARVDERLETWLDQRRLFSLRYAQRTR